MEKIMNRLIDTLVEYENGYHETDLDDTAITLHGVTFKQDFGPWKEGEEADTLFLDYERGVLEEWADDEVVRKCAIKLAVDNDRKTVAYNDEE